MLEIYSFVFQAVSVNMQEPFRYSFGAVDDVDILVMCRHPAGEIEQLVREDIGLRQGVAYDIYPGCPGQSL